VSRARPRVAVIGRTGRGDYGHQLDHAFTGHDRADVVAVADDDPDGLRAAVRRTGAWRGYADYRAMLDRERPDLVVVAPRWIDCHHDMAVAALDAGAHVYCEKPIAQTLEQADAMVAVAEARGLLLGVALPAVHEPRFGTLRDLIDGGLIGDVLQLKGLCKWDHRAGGQDFTVLGVHFADLIRRLGGDPLTCTGYLSGGEEPTEGGEHVGLVAGQRMWGAYRLTGDLLATIESWPCRVEDRARQPYRLEVHGSEGILVYRAPYADHSLWHHDGPAVLPGQPAWTRIPTKPVARYGDYHRLAATDFLDAIEAGREPACTGRDGVAALEMVHAVYASARAGGTVPLPLADRTHPLAAPRPRRRAPGSPAPERRRR
jgi:predicted dehydrogenase